MTTDRDKFYLVRGWAKYILSGDVGPVHPSERAAAEVIASLPDTIVDGDKLREVIAGHWAESEEDMLKAHLQDLLPAPAPPAPLVKVGMGVWAMHPRQGKVLIVSATPTPSGRVMIAREHGNARAGVVTSWVDHADLSPLPEDEHAPEDDPNGPDDSASVHARIDQAIADLKDKRVVEWPEGGKLDAPEDDSQEFDSVYKYRDMHGDHWVMNPTDEKWVCLNEVMGGHGTPPAEYGPYTRITKEEA